MSMSTEASVVVHGVHWETYEQLLADRGDAGPRLCYCDGVLEIMSPSFGHERTAHLLGRMVEAMTEELGIPIKSGRSTTFRSRRRRGGFEPDECYWVQHEPAVRQETRVIDLRRHPPPDLVLEAEASRSALDKLALFARLGVPEVWRHDGQRLAVHVGGDDGAMHASAVSRCFPWLPIDEFAARLAAADGTDETTWIRAFRVWVRDRFGPDVARS